MYWKDNGQSGYIYPNDVEKWQEPNDGWNDIFIAKEQSKILAIDAAGGVQKLLSDDGKLRAFIGAVEQRVADSGDE